MSTKQDVQKVDIDTYFSELDDHARIAAPKINGPQIKDYAQNLRKPSSLRQRLITACCTEDPVLQPYRNQRSMLSQERDFNAFELETAYGAVCKLKALLHNDPSPAASSVGISVTPNTATNDCSQASYLKQMLGISAALTATAVVIYASHPYVVTCLSEQCYKHLPDKLLEAITPLSETVSMSNLEKLKKAEAAADDRKFSESLKYAYAAAEMTQLAQTSEDWNQVVNLWQLALNNLESISSTGPLHSQSQAKKALYHSNLAYSRQELEMAPFRQGVKAAEEASKLAAEAGTEKDWQLVADRWQAALNGMQAVPSSSRHYSTAQAKLVEYSTKFAYTQKRYLDSQARPSH
jgi:hypothetical protein